MTQARSVVSTPLSREVEAVHSIPRTAIEGILKKLTGVPLFAYFSSYQLQAIHSALRTDSASSPAGW